MSDKELLEYAIQVIEGILLCPRCECCQIIAADFLKLVDVVKKAC